MNSRVDNFHFFKLSFYKVFVYVLEKYCGVLYVSMLLIFVLFLLNMTLNAKIFVRETSEIGNYYFYVIIIDM